MKKIKIPKEILVLGMIFLAVAGFCATAHAGETLPAGESCVVAGAAGMVAAGVETFAEKQKPTKARVAAWVGGGCALGLAMSAADSYSSDAPSENELKQPEPEQPQE